MTHTIMLMYKEGGTGEALKLKLHLNSDFRVDHNE